MAEFLYNLLSRLRLAKLLAGLINKEMRRKESPKELHKENTNYIFFFGMLGCGKSTIGATLASLMIKDPNISLIPHMGDPIGQQFLFREWVNPITALRFPFRTDAAVIVEVDMGLQVRASGSVPMTLIEISGERFNVIDPNNVARFEGEMDTESKALLKRSKVCFVVIDGAKQGADDHVIGLFLNHLQELFREQDFNISVAIIIAKWDLVPAKMTKREFLARFYPYTYGIILSEDWVHEIFEFSIGETIAAKDPEKTRISKVNWEDAKTILKWLWEVLD